MKSLLRLFLFLPGLIQTKAGAAQDSSRVAVVVSPALFVPVSVAVQGGLRLRLSNRWSLVAEGAFPTFYPDNTEYERIRYWRGGLEWRYAYGRKPGLRRYAGLQLSYLHRQLTDEGQAFYFTRTQTFSYTGAVINSPVLATALKWGVEIAAGKRVFVDAFVGGGLRFILTEYDTRSPLVTSLEPERQTPFSFDEAWKYNYTLMRLHATAGVRVGVRL